MAAHDGDEKGKIRESVIDGIHVIEIVLPSSNYDSFIKRTLTFLRFALAGVRIALRRDYDILFATSTPLTAGIPGIAAKLLRRKPFVFEVRDLWPEVPKAMGVIKNPIILAMMSFLEWTTYRASDACVALAPGIAEGIRKRAAPNHPICFVPNACDLDLFDTTADREDIWPDLDEHALICVYTGAHGQANGLDAALDAAGLLVKRGEKDIYLAFIGDGREKPQLVRRAQEEGLANCIFHDLVPKERLAKVLASSDVGMQLFADVPAFYYGTSPNKFFDYIASGLPVLNNYPGWLAELIIEHDCGVVIPPNDPAAFADALVLLRDEATKRRNMGDNARGLAASTFSRDILADKFCAFLEQQQNPRQADGSNA